MLTMNKKTLIILTSLPFIFSTISCGNSGKKEDAKDLCIDGTTNHTYVHHDKCEYDEKFGNDEYFSCSRCSKLFNADKKYIEDIPTLKPLRKIFIPSKLEGKDIHTLSAIPSKYLTLEEENDVTSYLKTYQNQNSCETNGIAIYWEGYECGESFTLQVSKDSNFSSIDYSIKNIKAYSATIYNLIPGKYYYRIKDENGNLSLTDSFVFVDEIRTIHSDKNGVSNMRDLAGWETITGDEVKYGMLYRCALPSSNDLSLFYWDLNIKTELDLRIKGGTNDEIGNFTGVGSQVITYVHPVTENHSYWPQYDYILSNNYKQDTKDYFQKVFDILSEETSYPLAFHCKSGADRTGTLAYIINGLCGVSFENLTRDYELTSFYKSPRWRSDIIGVAPNYSFDPSGLMQETGRWNYFHNAMMSTYGVDDNLQKTILNYLTNYCEVESNKIEKALSIILEGNAYKALFTE